MTLLELLEGVLTKALGSEPRLSEMVDYVAASGTDLAPKAQELQAKLASEVANINVGQAAVTILGEIMALPKVGLSGTPRPSDLA